MQTPIRVGIALVQRKGFYLIRIRPQLPGSPMPGVWEFPGGKCEPGESPEDATVRECLEEAGLAVRILSLRESRLHRYLHGLVELHYYECDLEDPLAEPATDSGFTWVRTERLPDLTFPEANAPILRALSEEARRGGQTPTAG